MRRPARWLGVLVALLAAASAAAHEQKEAVTRVLFNPRTGNIEVMHRFLVHDAEHASRALFDGGVDVLGEDHDRERFAAYVHARFSLSDQDGTPIPLNPVGHEIDHRFLWVYAEAPIPDHLSSLSVAHDALREVWPEQTNLVNVERGADVRSATFQGGRREISVRF
ncbi:MAG: DUF6702 family protein [Pseudomonadota bacterium]